jgi:hypothetical protein
MRRTLVAALSATAVMAALALVSAPAEAADIRCQIPFTFEVHGTTLPPGDYTFSAQPNMLFVRGYRHAAFALTNNEQSFVEDDAKVVFDHQGDDYVLRDVWTGGGVGREVIQPRVKAERGRTAEQGAPIEKVTIPAL